MPDSREHPTQASSEELTEPDWGHGVAIESGSSVTAQVFAPVVGIEIFVLEPSDCVAGRL